MASKADCIRAVEKAGVPPDRAAAIVDAVLAERKRLKAERGLEASAGEIARSVADMAQAERISLLRERRNTALTIIKRRQLDGATQALMSQGLPFDRALTTLLWGDRSRVAGARDSAARRIDALRTKWRSELTRELDKIPGLVEAIKKDKAFDAAIIREMREPGSTGDATARRAAEIFAKSLEDVRQTLNDAGANIGKLDNYAPQFHSAGKLLKAGREAWVSRMLGDLDWERTMPGLAPERRAEVLGENWTTIVTGQRHVPREPAGNPFRRPRNLASSFEGERVLHFKDAETAAAYHADFGEGTILDAVLSRIERGARRGGLMETFGPNPELMIQSLGEQERLRLRNLTPDEVRGLASGSAEKELSALEKKIDAGDANAAHEWERGVETLRAEKINQVGRFNVGDRSGQTGLALRVLMGETGAAETPKGAKLAGGLRALRNLHSVSSLGSAALAAIGDIQTKALWFRHGGESVFDSVRRAFGMALEGAQPAEKKEIGRALGFYADKFLGEFHARFSEGDAAPGWLARNVNTLFKISGLNAWTEAHKAAAGFYLSNRMGMNAGKAFGELDIHYAATLRRAGLEDRWPLIRKLAAKEADGNVYVLPENARNLSDEDLEPHMPERLRESKRPADAERAENFEAARLRERDGLRAGLEPLTRPA